jgi:hypothetical protein
MILLVTGIQCEISYFVVYCLKVWDSYQKETLSLQLILELSFL